MKPTKEKQQEIVDWLKSRYGNGDPVDDLVDGLADIIHISGDRGWDMDAIIKRARMHVEEEATCSDEG